MWCFFIKWISSFWEKIVLDCNWLEKLYFSNTVLALYCLQLILNIYIHLYKRRLPTKSCRWVYSSAEDLQTLVDRIFQASTECCPTISLNTIQKTTSSPPDITIANLQLNALLNTTYFGSTVIYIIYHKTPSVTPGFKNE